MPRVLESLAVALKGQPQEMGVFLASVPFTLPTGRRHVVPTRGREASTLPHSRNSNKWRHWRPKNNAAIWRRKGAIQRLKVLLCRPVCWTVWKA
ncbi:uncharacterized protein LOC135089705 isoform X3 [Scylla paramamosain]|uniref:uncharacterized protein LOC135089705 isoform X3 n=1 Tax=Scylla paramamosain TaxID=85552 RepID=UPI003082E4F3